MSRQIYSGEACNILGIEIRTFNKYVKKGTFEVVDTDPLGRRLFDEKQIRKWEKRRVKNRKKGQPAFK